MLSNARRFFVAALAAILAAGSAGAQVGRSPGLLDPNLATEQQLSGVPHLTPALVKSIMDKRPFLSMTALNAVLSPTLGKAQLTEVYGRLFLHLNLNTATKDEILMIPGVGNRMLHEFEEYRPYKNLAQFHREIGKYVKDDELARLESYVFVPINLNTASDADILTIPGLGNRMLREFKEYRPYKDMAQFRREIGKYVNEKEVARLERYVGLQ
jgi:DNA uptake protein ComE-like DNA-binding protein